MHICDCNLINLANIPNIRKRQYIITHETNSFRQFQARDASKPFSRFVVCYQYIESITIKNDTSDNYGLQQQMLYEIIYFEPSSGDISYHKKTYEYIEIRN